MYLLSKEIDDASATNLLLTDYIYEMIDFIDEINLIEEADFQNYIYTIEKIEKNNFISGVDHYVKCQQSLENIIKFIYKCAYKELLLEMNITPFSEEINRIILKFLVGQEQ